MLVIDYIMPILGGLSASRKTLGLNQQAVASQAGLAQTYLSKIEKAKVDPRLSTLQDVARAVKLEVMLVPNDLVPIVQALLGQHANPEERPLFQIEPD